MSLFGDILGAGASMAMGNPIGAASDIMQGIEGLMGGSNSQQQVGQQLAQLDQALQLPPGTLENIINSNGGGNSQASDPMGLGGGPSVSSAMQQAMNTMQTGMNEMQGNMQGLGAQNPGAAMQMQTGMGEMQAGMSEMQSVRGQHGPQAAAERHQAMGLMKEGMSEMKAGMQAMQNPGQTNPSQGLSGEAAEKLRRTIEHALKKLMEEQQQTGQNSLLSGGGLSQA